MDLVGQIVSVCSFLLILLHLIEFGSVLTAGENVKNKVSSIIIFQKSSQQLNFMAKELICLQYFLRFSFQVDGLD